MPGVISKVQSTLAHQENSTKVTKISTTTKKKIDKSILRLLNLAPKSTSNVICMWREERRHHFISNTKTTNSTLCKPVYNTYPQKKLTIQQIR